MIGRLAFSFLLAGATALYSQAIPTASRLADAQVGGGYSIASPDYVHQTFPGFGIYGDLDFTSHLGAELEYHQVFSTSGDKSFERTYDIGGRYFRKYGPFKPYVKAMVGRGDFQYPFGYTELGYWMFPFGGGLDVDLTPHIRVRGDYEFQKWINFPNGGFTPQIVTIGVAFHFSNNPRLH